MSNYSKIYWLTRLDQLQTLFTFMIVLSIIGLILYYLGRGLAGDMEFNEDKKLKIKQRFLNSYSWLPKVAYTLLCTGAILGALIPSKNDMIMIYAGGKTMDYVQKDTILAKVPFQTTAIISEYLDKTLKEMKEDKK